MVAGHLQVKKGRYYVVLSYTDSRGRRKQPWIATGLREKGNKKRAEKMMMEIRQNFVIPKTAEDDADLSTYMLFSDYMIAWLKIIKPSVAETTFTSYSNTVMKRIVPYFKEREITLGGLQAKDIQSYYLHELKTLSPNTVTHSHAQMNKALKYAVKMELIPDLKEKLLARKAQQEENKRVCGSSYNYENDGYIFVDAMGKLFNPHKVTDHFRTLLKQNGLRPIRFHDLRHSCASLLVANQVPMKQIQKWLGHSDMSTTANIYSHLDFSSKLNSANIMDGILSFPETKKEGWTT